MLKSKCPLLAPFSEMLQVTHNFRLEADQDLLEATKFINSILVFYILGVTVLCCITAINSCLVKSNRNRDVT